MANKVLISQSSIVQAYSGQSFSGSDSARVIQFNPQVGIGFSGSVSIQGSYAPTPGNNDYTEILNVTFTNHVYNLTLEVQSNAPNIRAQITSSTQGSIAVLADSINRTIQGSQGATPATAYIESPNRVAGSGNGFKINSIVVPQFTSDDIFYANDLAKTITDMLDGTNGALGKQDKIGTGVLTVSEADVNTLSGVYTYGLRNLDIKKMADINASAVELNRVIGATSNIQTQLNTITGMIPPGLAGLTVTAAAMNAFFNQTTHVTMADLNQLDGLTTSAADLNPLTGSAGTFVANDMTKLGSITATAVEINVLDGYTGVTADLNKLATMTTTTADLNIITGLASAGITVTNLGYLSGLTTNVQATLNSIPNLVGMTATVNDLNTFRGIFNGTGVYSNPITATEVNYLNGLTSNIQTQLNNRRSIGVQIGVSEISGAAITITELNYLQGLTSNIQSQITALSSIAFTSAGGSLTGKLFITNGTAALPGLGFISPNTTTGFYLFGANGLGISIAGTRFLSADGVDLQVGIGTGSPTIKGNGYGLTTPAYTYTGDENTGIWRNSADSVQIVGGAKALATFDGLNNNIIIGGLASNNHSVAITGVFAGEKILNVRSFTAGAISGALATTSMYTVPTGRTTIITKVFIRLTLVTNFTDGSLFRFNAGITPTPNELIDNVNNTGLFNPGSYSFSTVGQIMPLGTGGHPFPTISGNSGAAYAAYTAGTVLSGQIAALAGADDFNFDVIIFGYEF